MWERHFQLPTARASTRRPQPTDEALAVIELQQVLDAHCVASVHINPESRVKVVPGPAPKQLVQGGWRSFLVKVHNEAGITSALVAVSPNAAAPFARAGGDPGATGARAGGRGCSPLSRSRDV